MTQHVILIKFTDKGLAHIAESPKRADAFRAQAKQAGARVQTVLWTTGPYDGVILLEAPDEQTAAGVVLNLARGGNVSTCMLRAFDEADFARVLGVVK